MSSAAMQLSTSCNGGFYVGAGTLLVKLLDDLVTDERFQVIRSIIACA
jgi:hypothetical protein